MAAGLADYVLETATNPGTGSFTLNGAETGRRPFSAAFKTGDSVFYFASDGTQAEWGIGTFTSGSPNMLARSTVAGNTAGTKSALNFTGKTEVYNEIPAIYMLLREADLSVLVPAISDWKKRQALGALDADGRYLQLGGGAIAFLNSDGDIKIKTGKWLYADTLKDNGAGAITIESPLVGLSNAAFKDSVRSSGGVGWSGGTTTGTYRWGAPFFIGPVGSTDYATGKFLVGMQFGDIIGNQNHNQSGLCLFLYAADGSRTNYYFSNSGQIMADKVGEYAPKNWVSGAYLPLTGGDIGYLNVNNGDVRVNNGRGIYSQYHIATDPSSGKYAVLYLDSSDNMTWDLDNKDGSNINWLRLYADGHLQTGAGRIASENWVNGLKLVNSAVGSSDYQVSMMGVQASSGYLWVKTGNDYRFFLPADQIQSSYVNAATYNADFGTSDQQIINLPYNHKIQKFKWAGGSATVTFPQAFGGGNGDVVCLIYPNMNNAMDVPGVYNITTTGFQYHGTQALEVIAIGPK
ncbi:MAG: hypothetical protein LKH33_06865 [Acetobacter sp.]|jgi:hypothetical protein|nr:hypothetical protein [Acetobacter sp.]MCH4060500.1 hypothetical protein [Acetobacter sp.]MCH4087440.1 hypothetical protein [Acetobacter sp.]MCI1293958.1 hypothetical protein [Acetobacter sp.]MCI1320448.1 hypothetical protein [Acetobacter sp.]